MCSNADCPVFAALLDMFHEAGTHILMTATNGKEITVVDNILCPTTSTVEVSSLLRYGLGVITQNGRHLLYFIST